MIHSGDTGSLCSQGCVQILRLKRFFLLSPLREQNCHLEISNWGRLAICYVERAKEISVNWIPLPHQHCKVIFEKEGLYGLSEGTVLSGSLCSTICWCLNFLVNNLLLPWFIVTFFYLDYFGKIPLEVLRFCTAAPSISGDTFLKKGEISRQDVRPYWGHLDRLSLCPFVFRQNLLK